MESKVKINRIIVIIIAVLVTVVAIGLVVFSNSPSQRVRKQLELGQKYLSELNYEQAVAAFKEALNIEPGNADAQSGIVDTYVAWSADMVSQSEFEAAVAVLDEARTVLPDNQELNDFEADIYLKWAQEYEDSGDLEIAISILQEGLNKTNSAKLQEKIEEYSRLLEQDEVPEETFSESETEVESEEEPELYRLVEGYYKAPSITLRERISYEGDSIVDSTAYTRTVFEPTGEPNEYKNYDREGQVATITVTGEDEYTYELREAESNASLLTFHYKYYGETAH